MENPQENATSSWMDRLAAESWQAEMVISGVAIFGSFQLFGWLYQLIDWMYFSLPESLMGVAYFLVFYFFLGIVVLSISFIMHFVIRAIWIASIGLESVYPQGILRENDAYSTHFMDQLLQRYGSLHDFNEKLDRVASAVLAIALLTVMILVGIGVFLSFILLIGYVASSIWNEDAGLKVALAVLGILITIIFFNAMLNDKQLREREWVKKIHFPLNMLVTNYLSFNVFATPSTYFMYTIRTNVGSKKFSFLSILLICGVSFSAIGLVKHSHILYLNSYEFYFRADERTDKLNCFNYEDEAADYPLAYIHPMLPSQVIHHTSELRLFLPIPEREERLILATCSQLEPKDVADRDAKRKAGYAYYTACYDEKIEVLIDNAPVAYTFKKYEHPHQKEFGLLFYFPDLVLTDGEHILSIKHLALKQEDYKIDNVPFFYLPNKD